jgi:hypothetical protein
VQGSSGKTIYAPVAKYRIQQVWIRHWIRALHRYLVSKYTYVYVHTRLVGKYYKKPHPDQTYY